MKKPIILFLILSLIANGLLQAQDRRTLETKIADILAQMPAEDLAYRDRLVEELFSLGKDGFLRLSSLLVAPGKGNDAAARMAINSMARVASLEEGGEHRTFMEKVLLGALDNTRDPEVKRFLIHQLNLVISDAAVPALVACLHDTMLYEPATQALLSLRSEAAAAALLQALEGANGAQRITLIKALGELRHRPAAPVIQQYAGSKDPTQQRVTLQALARIGDPVSYKTLWQTASLAEGYEPTMALASFVTYLDRLGEEGEKELCEQGIEALLKKCTSPALLHDRAAAVAVKVHCSGREALPLLCHEAENPDKAYRGAILDLATQLGKDDPAVTKRWFALARKADPSVRADILAMLGHRGDKSAAAWILKKKMLEDPNPQVRQAALETYTRLTGKEALPLLLDHLKSGQDVPFVRDLILTLVGRDDLPQIAATACATTGEALAACLYMIGVRGGSDYFHLVYEQCSSDDPQVRSAAYAALPGVVSAADLSEALELLLSARTEEEVTQARQAVVTALNEAPDKKAALDKLVKVMDAIRDKERIISLLPAAGTPEALQAAEEIFTTSEGEEQEAAFRALASWPDASVLPVLYRIATQVASFSHRAFVAFVKKVDSSDLPDEQKLLQLRKIMPLATVDAEKKMVLKAVGKLHIFPALVYAGQYLDEPYVANAAARAVTQIALPSPDGRKGMEGKIVRELLEKAKEKITGEESNYLKARIEDYLEKMPEVEGFVPMFNGKDLSGWKGFVANPIRLARMSPEEIKEKQKEADKEMHQHWSVQDHTIVFNGKGHNLVSEKNYGNFELWVDWRITKGGDSGIYLRGTPQVQIWDTSRREVGAQVGSGGLYNNKRHRSTPLKVADNPVGEWNTFHIIMVDSIVTVWLNGELVVDHVPLENYWDRSRPIFPTGPIELQAHGTDLAFRDIYIR